MAFREFRVKHHKTQAELADMLGMSRTQVARVELGLRGTTKAALLLLERLDRELSEARKADDAATG